MIASPDLKLMADDTARAYRRAGFEVHTAAFRYGFPLAQVARDGGGVDVDVSVQTEIDRDALFDRVLPHQALVGAADAPHVLGFPYILPPGARLEALLRGSGEVGPVRLTLEGVKLYTQPYTRAVILPDVPELEAA